MVWSASHTAAEVVGPSVGGDAMVWSGLVCQPHSTCCYRGGGPSVGGDAMVWSASHTAAEVVGPSVGGDAMVWSASHTEHAGAAEVVGHRVGDDVMVLSALPSTLQNMLAAHAVCITRSGL